MVFVAFQSFSVKRTNFWDLSPLSSTHPVLSAKNYYQLKSLFFLLEGF